jgi:hypothetical protein
MGRIFRNPTIQGALQATAFQRTVAFGAMLLAVTAVLYWPEIRDGAGSAIAQTQDNSYQPFNCGQAGSSNPQQRRQNLQLNGTGGGAANGHAYPCISGVQWKLKAGTTSSSTAGPSNIIAVISAAYSTIYSSPIYWAGTGSSSNLVQVSIAGLQFCNGSLNLTANGYGCTPSLTARNIQLYADSSTGQGYVPKTPYVLNIIPSGPITVGGNGMQTDIFGVGSSLIATDLAALPSFPFGQAGNCATVGGTATGNMCTLSLSSFSGSLAQTLAGGGTFPLFGMDLTFYYLITHTGSTTNPYNPLEVSGNSVTLPNTRLVVGNGS